MTGITVTVDEAGGAYVALAPASTGQVRDSVDLDGLDKAQGIAALGSLVLDFDHYGRLIGIGVSGSAASVLPPALLDEARQQP